MIRLLGPNVEADWFAKISVKFRGLYQVSNTGYVHGGIWQCVFIERQFSGEGKEVWKVGFRKVFQTKSWTAVNGKEVMYFSQWSPVDKLEISKCLDAKQKKIDKARLHLEALYEGRG